jgi:hypothetical protein
MTSLSSLLWICQQMFIGTSPFDRARLEEATCECYDIIRGATDRIVPHEVVGSHPHFDGHDDDAQEIAMFSGKRRRPS